MTSIKTENDLIKMRAACSIAAEVLMEASYSILPGATTYDLDQCVKNLLLKYKAKSACYNYQVGKKKYPGYCCVSVNDEIVHGIGNVKKVLKDGDIVTLDVCVNYDGFIGDNAKTYPVGQISTEAQRLLRVTESALHEGISKAVVGNRIGDISFAIQSFVEKNGYSVVRDFVGHGVGRQMHEPPEIPNFGKPGTGSKLVEGMTLAIEPMVNEGASGLVYAKDGWTALTEDKKLSAHFEHVVLVTEMGPEILTVAKKNEKK